MIAATDLFGIVVLLLIAVVAVLVLFFDALCKILVGAVAALVRAPWRSHRLGCDDSAELLRRQEGATRSGKNPNA